MRGWLLGAAVTVEEAWEGDDVVFGGLEDDEDDEEPEAKRARLEDAPLPPAPAPAGPGEGPKKRKRVAEENASSSESPSKKRRTLTDWLESSSESPVVSSWLGMQTLLLGRAGMYGPMAVSATAFVFAAGNLLKSLTEKAAQQILAVSFGFLGLGSGFAEDLPGACSNILILIMVAVFFFNFGEDILNLLDRARLAARGGDGPGGEGGPGVAPPAVVHEAAAGTVVEAPPPPPTPVPGPPAGGLEQAVRAEAGAGAGLGDFARRLGLAGSLGGPGLVADDKKEGVLSAVDERVLPLEVASGERWRGWESVIRNSRSPVSPEWTAHLKGSPSVLEVFRGYRQAGGPLSHHREWVKHHNLHGKPHGHERFTLCAALELLACFDQLNVPSLLGCELLVRRVMLLESAHELANNGRPEFFHSEEIMGFLARPSGAVIAGGTEVEVGERLRARAEIQKHLTKAKEATGVPKGPKRGAQAEK